MTPPHRPHPSGVLRLKVIYEPNNLLLNFILHSDSPDLCINMANMGKKPLVTDLNSHFDGVFNHLSMGKFAHFAQTLSGEHHPFFLKKGQKLFEDLFPQRLQRTLWELRGKGLGLQIKSNETVIPWPLIAMQSPVGVLPAEDGRFLSEAFRLTQWVEGGKPNLHFPMNRIAHMAIDGGLDRVASERQFMHGLTNDRRSIFDIEPNMIDWCDAMTKGGFDGYHFSGHSHFNEPHLTFGPAIELEDGQLLTPEVVTGAARSFGETKPLVFFNSCFSGRAARDLTGETSWPKALIRHGAGGVIGTLWEVEDRSAFEFARQFYQAFLDGDCFGEAVQKARARVREIGSPCWLAFAAYGDPEARVSPLRMLSQDNEPTPSNSASHFRTVAEICADRLAALKYSPHFPAPASSKPSDFCEFFWAQRQSELTSKDRHRELAVLATLAQVREPITTGMLATFSKRPVSEIEGMLEAWRPLLKIEEAVNQDGVLVQAFSFFHASLVAFIRTKARQQFGSQFDQQTHRRIVQVLTRLRSAS